MRWRPGPVAEHTADFVAVFVTAFALTLGAWATLPAAVTSLAATVVQSDSMLPAIRPGDVVLVDPEVPPAGVVGGVVQFDDPRGSGRRLLHRVRRVDDDGLLVTGGDANADDDPMPITADDIRGVGRILVPFAGQPAVWLRTGEYGSFAATLLVIAFAIAWMGRRLDAVLGSAAPARTPGRQPRIGTATTVLVAMALLTVPGTAGAGFVSDTSTTGGWQAATLEAPATVTAQCGDNAIEVSWSAVPPGPGVTYEVERTSPTFSSWTTTSTTITDAVALVGLTRTYRVRATIHSWSGPWKSSNTIVLGIGGGCVAT